MALWIEDTKNTFVDREKFESGRVEIADKSNRQSYQVCCLFVCLFSLCDNHGSENTIQSVVFQYSNICTS